MIYGLKGSRNCDSVHASCYYSSGFGQLDKFYGPGSSAGKDRSTGPVVNAYQQAEVIEDLITFC
jgi:hypothetical protein